jgi:type I restriction enzyme S subunit
MVPQTSDRIQELILKLAFEGQLTNDQEKHDWISGKTLKDFGQMHRGITYSKSDSRKDPAEGFIPLLGAANIQETLNYSNMTYVPSELIKAQQMILEGDVLICMSSGSKSLVGKAAMVHNPMQASFGAFCAVYRPSNLIDREFLKFFFKSSKYRKEISQSSRGIGINNLRIGDIESIQIPLPPIEKQKEIVSKIKDLLYLSSEFESLLASKVQLANSIRLSALDAISTAQSPDEMQIAWERIHQNWEVIAGSPESVTSLRNLIRELAMQGQITNIAQNFHTEYKDTQEVPHKIPSSWSWVKLGDVIDFINGYAFKSDEYIEHGVGVVRMSDMKSGGIIQDHMKFVSSDRLETLADAFQVKPGNIVMGMTGATLGKPCVNKTSETFLLNQRIGKIVPRGIDPDYLLQVLFYLEPSFMRMSFGTGVNNLSTQQIKESLIPLPPASEQKLIVTKLNELFTICDQLEIDMHEMTLVGEEFARSLVSALA